jgi:5-dehydro-2-deoxygluconokinase
MKFIYEKNRSLDVICMGRVGVDLYAEQIGSPLRDVQTFRKYLGGSPGNISVGTSKLGLKSALFSCVGTDEMGQFLKKQLLKENVNIDMLVESKDYLTALAVLGVQPPDKFPLIFYRQNCADMQLQESDIQEHMISDSKTFQFSGTGISTESMRKTTKVALELCKKYNTKVVLDIDYRPVLWGLTAAGDGEERFRKSIEVTKYYKEFLPYCDLIVGTDEELCIAAGTSEPDDAIRIIQQCTQADVIYKTGLQGSELHSHSDTKVIVIPAYVVDVFNTLGAGDAYMSGLLKGLLIGKNWQTSLSYANAAGAIVCSRHGCSPAMPSIDELNYFIKGYNEIGKKILEDRKLDYLHSLTDIGKPSDYPLALLAYDHRYQFEAICDDHKVSYKLITKYKKLVYQAYREVCSSYIGNNLLGVICDQKYGYQVLQNATKDQTFVLAPVEESGIDLLEWIGGSSSAYELLVTQPQHWGVKVLWKYHNSQDEKTKSWQLRKLKELARACENLQRRLMLELIIPSDYEVTGESITNAIRDVYKINVYPFWWKLQAVYSQNEWRQIDRVISTYDTESRIIVLGGEAKSIQEYQQDFKIICSSKLVHGFAFGRSIFWNIWIDYCQGKISDDKVKSLIAKRYQAILNMWAKAKEKESTDNGIRSSN